MGFFDDLWSGIKSVGSSVWNGVKDTAGAVYNTAKSGVDWVADQVQPIVKAVGKYGGYIPGIGPTIRGAAGTVDSLIDQVKGGLNTVGSVGKNIGLLNQANASKPKFSRMAVM